MESFWSTIEKLDAWYLRYRTVLFAALGLALLSLSFSSVLRLAYGEMAQMTEVPLHAYETIGEIIASIGAVIIFSLRYSFKGTPAAMIAVFAFFVIGTGGFAICRTPLVGSPQVVLPIACVILGIGKMGIEIAWLEFCVRDTPARMLITVSLWFLLRCILEPAYRVIDKSLFFPLALACMCLSLILLLACYSRMPDSVHNIVLASEPAPPRMMMLWVCLFFLVYGMVANRTEQGVTSYTLFIGAALSAVMLLAVLIFARKTLEVRQILGIIMVCAVMSLFSVVSDLFVKSLSQVLMSSASALAFCFIYLFVQHRLQANDAISPNYELGLLLGCATACALIGKALASAFSDVTSSILVIAILIIGIVFVSVFFVSSKLQNLTINVADPAEDVQEQRLLSIEELGRNHGLAQRESDILMMLAQGKVASEISSELVLSKGAVRAHISNIYKKFSVHSRSELNRMLMVKAKPPKKR